MKREFIVTGLNQPTRLDRVLRGQFPNWGRQAVDKLIAARQVRVNGQTVWLASWLVRNQDRIALAALPQEKSTQPQHFADAWLLAEYADLLVVNKPAGLLAEPTRWGTGTNLRDLASARFGPLILFHRLDRDTSGVVLLTRPGPINQQLDRAFKQQQIEKEYLAVVAAPNQLAPIGEIRLRLAPDPARRDRMVTVTKGGQFAHTRYEILATAGDRQWLRLWPQTGRTHQLRVHLAALGAPILGDRLYGSADAAPRLLLHARQLSLPVTEPFPAHSWTAPVPAEFALDPAWLAQQRGDPTAW